MAEQVVSSEYDSSDDEAKDNGYIMLTDDDGIQKKILIEGQDSSDLTNGPIHPPKNSTVHCHYVGRLLESGKQFDTSRKRGKTKKGKIIPPTPYKFILGQGKVLKAWDIAIPTMKRGEVSLIRCSPDYAYGDKGMKDVIPPNSWLEFEIELVDWDEWQSINEGIKKKIITNGYKAINPNSDDFVSLSYSLYVADNEIIHKSHVTVVVDDDLSFVDGFHIALKSMNEGEIAMIDITDCKYGYGAEGSVDLDIPYFADLCFKIEVHHIQRAKAVNEYTEIEIIKKAKKYKIEGNELFGMDSFEFAIRKYKKALRWIEYVKNEQKERDKMMIDVNNNICLIMMKRERYDQVIVYAQKVLEVDENNVKALSRSGHAKIKQKRYLDAKIDLKRAKNIDGNNSYVKKLYDIAMNKVKQEKKRQQKRYKSMFGYRPEITQ